MIMYKVVVKFVILYNKWSVFNYRVDSRNILTLNILHVKLKENYVKCNLGFRYETKKNNFFKVKLMKRTVK